MNDITVIGSNMVDLITYIDRMPVEGETLEAPEFEQGWGGKGSNQAVAAARLGSKVLMITKIGNDNFGEGTMANYQKNGLDVSGVEVGTKNSGTAPIFVDKHSKNRILIIKGANAELTPSDLDKYKAQIKETKIIILQLEIPLETVYHAIEIGNELNVPVLLNPAPADKNLALDYVRRCTYFAPNETELAILTDLPTTTVEEIQIAAQTLVDQGVNNVIITMGSKGVMWLDGSHVQIIKAHQVKAIDTTGAGDSFVGCFAHYVAGGMAIADALEMANKYAAQAVMKKGTQSSYPTMAQFQEGLPQLA